MIKISTYVERKNIGSHLNRIDQYLTSPNNFLIQFEALKVLLRNYDIRYFSDRHIEFEKEVEEVSKIKLDLQQILAESNILKGNIDNSASSIDTLIEENRNRLQETESELENIIQQKEKLIQESEQLETINSNLSSISKDARENLEEIDNSLNESKSNEKLISSFANNIQEKDNRLAELETTINENNLKLVKYEKERKSILNEANSLIESAKKALNYKTAEGISASFQNQYNNSNNFLVFGSWILGAILCLGLTIALGIWILNTNIDTNPIWILLGRISLLPLPIIGAVFCANQYTKQKNIIEDYAYKMTLSKAIVGFSEQLKKNGTNDNEEYIHYIKTALEEIHRDPLRKREHSKQRKDQPINTNFKEMFEVAEKIVKLTKPN